MKGWSLFSRCVLRLQERCVGRDISLSGEKVVAADAAIAPRAAASAFCTVVGVGAGGGEEHAPPPRDTSRTITSVPVKLVGVVVINNSLFCL